MFGIKARFAPLTVLALAISSASALGAANPSDIPAVASIASMVALGVSSPQYPTIQVKGYYSGSSSGGGTFDWQTPSTNNNSCTADGGTVFLATGVLGTTGCWVRQLYGNQYLASWFGAKASNSTADETINATAIQAGLTASYAAAYKFQLDQCGRYYINNTLSVPSGAFNYNAYPFGFTGCGAGVAYAAKSLATGSILAMDPAVNKTLFAFLDPTPHSAGSTGEISNIRFEGTTTGNLVYLQVMTYHFSFHDNQLVQSGNGDGLDCDGCGNATIANNFNYAPAGSSGTGFKIATAIGFGLMNIENNTSRGYSVCYQLGGGAGSETGMTTLRNESSNCSTGINILNGTEGAILDSNYFEGTTGTSIMDCGDYTKVLNSNSNEYSQKFIDNATCGTPTVGNVYQNNFVSRTGATLGGTPQATTYFDILDNGASTSTGKIIPGNYLNLSGAQCSGPCPNVTGIKIAGAAPRISMLPGNIFTPYSAWPGTSSTQIDCSGITGTPVGDLQCTDNGVSVPLRPSLSATTLVDAAIATNVLTLPGVNPLYQMNLVGSATINSFAPANIIQGTNVCIESANANPTFAAGAGILIGSSYTPGASGGVICGFFTKSGSTVVYHVTSTLSH